MECNAKYHIERYLDSKGIHIDILEYKFVDIRDLVRRCRYGELDDLECRRQVLAHDTNVPSTPPHTVTVLSASYGGSSTYPSSGTLSSSSRDPSPSAGYSPSPLPSGVRLPSSPAETELPSKTFLELPNWPQSESLLPTGSDTEGDISDSSEEFYANRT